MPYRITCSTKILTLARAPFLFILVGVLCEFAMASSGYILLSPLLPEGKDVHIQQHFHQKDLNFCLPLYYYSKVIVESERTQTSSTLKFLFVFGFNECL